MKLTENYISRDSTVKHWDWGQYNCSLKHNYKNENSGEVKIIKLSNKEMNEYLKKFKNK